MEKDQMRIHLSDDTILQLVHKKFIKLQMEEVREAQILLNQVVNDLVNRMKEKDPLFARVYNKIVFCGSFYKGTKISKPNEFDINIILNLSTSTVHPNNIHFSFNQPAFVKIEVSNSNNTPATRYILPKPVKRKLDSLIDNGYLNPHKFRYWIEEVLSDLNRELPLKYNSTIELIKIKKSGPAFTLILRYLIWLQEEIHIDIVPALNFDTDIIVNSSINFNTIQKYTNKEWFAISVPKNTIHGSDDNLHWRQSFFYQEKVILEKHGRMKNIIRLMKKLRDTQKWSNVASYFIETLVLNKLENIKDKINTTPLPWLFYLMLKEMHHDFKQQSIKYFWDGRYNLLSKIGKGEMFNITQRLERIITNIEKKAESDPFIIARYILNQEEFAALYEEYNTRQLAVTDISDDEEQERNRNWCTIL